jgi:N-acetylneuraminate synthase
VQTVFVIAEAGVNHNGRLELALALCDAALRVGADAVKFQTFRAEDLVVPGAPTAGYQQRQTGHDDQAAMLRQLELSEEDHFALKRHCDSLGIEFLSTPFSRAAVAMLTGLGVRRFKLPSGELTHRALIETAAATGLPLIVSTGMATHAEIDEALTWVRAVRGSLSDVTILHCTSAYPAEDAMLNLSAISTMRAAWPVAVGYSDHSLGIDAALAAVALGATVIEKHLTLDRTLPGPDHAASLEPADFEAMVLGIRRVERMLGDGRKEPQPAEREVAAVARRSVVLAREVAAGAVLAESDLQCRRPGTGIAPRELPELVGRRVARALAVGQLLAWDDLLAPDE